MIISFRHKGLEIFYKTASTRGIQAAHAQKIRRILAALDVASSPTDLNHPGYKLHPLRGDLQDHWSVWVNGNGASPFVLLGQILSWLITKTITRGEI